MQSTLHLIITLLTCAKRDSNVNGCDERRYSAEIFSSIVSYSSLVSCQKGFSLMATEEGTNLVPERRESIWSVGVRQVVYIALGIALYAVLNIIFNLVQLPNAGGGAIALRPGIVIAEIASAIAIAVGIAIAAYNDIWVSKISFAAANSEFIVAGIPDLINGLILLPILLIAYNAAIRSRGRAY